MTATEKIEERRADRSSRRKRALSLRSQYETWKTHGLQHGGWFPVFNGFKHTHLKTLSGNALRLYLYFGLHGKRSTGESWHDIDTIALFFEKSSRAIKLWIRELEDAGLIERLQMSPNGVAFTYLLPYQHKSALALDDDQANDEDDAEESSTPPPSEGQHATVAAEIKPTEDMVRLIMSFIKSQQEKVAISSSPDKDQAPALPEEWKTDDDDTSS